MGTFAMIHEYTIVLDTINGPFRFEIPGIKSYRESSGVKPSCPDDDVFEDIVTGCTFAISGIATNESASQIKLWNAQLWCHP